MSLDESSCVQRLTDHLPNLSRTTGFARSQSYRGPCSNGKTQEPKTTQQKEDSHNRYSQNCILSHLPHTRRILQRERRDSLRSTNRDAPVLLASLLLPGNSTWQKTSLGNPCG